MPPTPTPARPSSPADGTCKLCSDATRLLAPASAFYINMPGSQSQARPGLCCVLWLLAGGLGALFRWLALASHSRTLPAELLLHPPPAMEHVS